MDRQTGTIEDVVAVAKSRYSNVEDQAKYIQIAIDLIKRDHSDDMTSLVTTHGGYDYQVTGFPSDGVAYFWYNIYRGSQKKASKLEAVRKGNTRVLFCSNSEFCNPITPVFMR